MYRERTRLKDIQKGEMEGSLPNFETEATKFNEEIGERMVHNNHQTEEEPKQDHQVYIKDYFFSTKY